MGPMKNSFKYKSAKYLVSALTLLQMSLFADAPAYEVAPTLTYSTSASSRHKQRSSKKKHQSLDKRKSAYQYQEMNDEQWTPHFRSINFIEESRAPFFQFNVGLGFLYFSGISANLGGSPITSFAPPQGPAPDFSTVPFEGKLNYTHTPIYEAILGYKLFPWFKLGMSYQHQGNVFVATEALQSGLSTLGKANFQSTLSLDALMAKVYFETPTAMLIKHLATTLYIGAGCGAGWQSYSDVRVQYLDTVGTFRNRYLALNNKVSANVVWMADIGFRMQDSIRNQKFSVVLGCKFNDWGQARNIGGANDQDQSKLGLAKPFKIKMVYSFSPYLGAQWSFPASYNLRAPYTLQGRETNSWIPFWLRTSHFVDKGIWTQFNVGPGFLYFANVRGVLVADGPTPTPTVGRPNQFQPLVGGFEYNKTPLMEFLIGGKIRPWLKAAISYQYQIPTFIQSNWQSAQTPILGVNQNNLYRLSSMFSVNAIMAKFYFDSFWSMVFKGVGFTPYVAAGVGASWQTWADVSVQDVIVSPGNSRNNNPRFLNWKSNANVSWMVDIGTKLKSVYPNVDFSFLAGCKFNYWGQARNIGSLSQQGPSKEYLIKPLNIKNVYSFAPYLGVQWNFPVDYSAKAPFMIHGRCPNTWSPFGAKASDIQNPNSLWTQYNVGLGLLYFYNPKGILTGIPSQNFNYEAGNPDFQGKLSYNRTPLSEYLIGYRFMNWLKLAFSYQHQANVSIQSAPQQATIATPSPATQLIFRSDLMLDGVMLKGYCELPWVLVFKNVATSPYLAIGVGMGWQTWDASYVQHLQLATGSLNYISRQPLHGKVSANCICMADLGMRMRSAYPNAKFSILLGCKFNDWGQARNIGKLSQQGSLKEAISQPFRIEAIYQFAPYIGVQWDF